MEASHFLTATPAAGPDLWICGSSPLEWKHRVEGAEPISVTLQFFLLLLPQPWLATRADCKLSLTLGLF